MRPELTFSGDFDIQPMTSLAPGDWYIGFRCENCGAGVAAMEDPTGSGDLVLSGAGRLRAACPACGQVTTFTPLEMRLFQSPSGGLAGEAI